MRKLNYENNLGIRFNGISIHSLTQKLCFSLELALEQLEKLNPNFCKLHQDNIVAAENLSKQVNNIDNYLSITQVHDFIYFFHAVCTGIKIHSRHFKVESISMSLRCAYHYDFLKETKLFRDITKFSILNCRKFWK